MERTDRMDRRGFVKRTCLGSAGLFLGGFGPNIQEGILLPVPPPIQVCGLKDFKPSPLGMPGLFPGRVVRSEEHTLNSSHLVISYAVFCLKNKISSTQDA